MSTPTDVTLRRCSLALFLAIVALDLVFISSARAVQGDPALTYPDAGVEESEAVGILVFGLVGLLLAWLRPRNPVGWLLSAAGLSLVACDAGQFLGALMYLSDPRVGGGTVVMALGSPLWVPALAVGPTFLLARYPSGHIEGRWIRRFDRLALGGLAVLYVGYAASAPAVTDMVESASSPFGVPSLVADSVAAVGGVALLVALVVIVADGVRRLIRSRDRRERKALAVFWGAAVAASLMSFASPYEWMLSVAWFSIAIAIAVGVLRYGALGIQVTVLTGDSRDPFAALSRLGSPLGGDVDEHSLTGVLTALREALEVDGVAVEGPVSASAGSLPDSPTSLPLQFGGADVGVLLVGHRAGGTPLGRSGQRVLEAVAPLISAVIHAVQVAEELRGHQERVVAATQAERVRLRQELHDGLGPALTGIGLGLEALATRVPEGGDELVSRLRTEVAGSLEETRRIIDDLRPSALDDGDLAAAVRRRAEQLRTSGLDVAVEIDEELPPLPAAVAAATFRIAEEALTNVVRHSGAERVRLGLRLVDDCVLLEVADDGRGPGIEREGGVGVGSMRDRAERLGGTFTIGPADPAATATAAGRPGTLVRVELPLVVAP